MRTAMNDPIRDFEHTHGALSIAVVEVSRHVAKMHTGSDAREALVQSLEALREELLQHFADEEEALFPFVRKIAPKKADAVDKLEAAHDTICGTVTRLVHLAARDPGVVTVVGTASSFGAVYERFESAYAAHSQTEADLFKELDEMLDDGQRAVLREYLHGL